MYSLFDPLIKLAALGAYPHLTSVPGAEWTVTLTYARATNRKAQRAAQALASRFERLLVLQLDVEEGQQPRTVQQLLAANRIKIRNGRYVMG